MSNPRELHKHLAGKSVGMPVNLVVINIDNAATADATVALFAATRKCRILRASYVQESDATAATTFVATLQVGATALTDALDIKTLGADTADDWVPVDGVDIADGDIVDIVFNETGGTVTAPDLVSIALDVQYLE